MKIISKLVKIIVTIAIVVPTIVLAVNITVPQSTADGDILRGNTNGTYTPTAFSSIGFVPYTGATGDVDLGTNNLTIGTTLTFSGAKVIAGNSNTVNASNNSGAFGKSNQVYGSGGNWGIGYNNELGTSNSSQSNMAFGISNILNTGVAGTKTIAGAFGYGNTIQAANSFVFGSGITNTIANSVAIGASNTSKSVIYSDGKLEAIYFNASSTSATSNFYNASTTNLSVGLVLDLPFVASTSNGTVYATGNFGIGSARNRFINSYDATGYGGLQPTNLGVGLWANSNNNTTTSQTGYNNSAFGQYALSGITSGNGNTTVGVNSGGTITTGSRNTLQGAITGRSLISGDDNTGVGYNTLDGLTGSRNTTLGTRAGSNISSGNANIVIGANVNIPTGSASGQMNIGNVLYGTGFYNGTSLSSVPTSTGKIGIGTTSPASAFSVAGNSYFGGTILSTSTITGTGLNIINPAGFATTYFNGASGAVFQNQTGQFLIDQQDASNDIVFRTNSTARLNIKTTSGFVGIGTTSPAAMFGVGGSAYISGNATATNIYATGTINFTKSTSTTRGVINQDNVRFIHNYGTDNVFIGLGAGNFTLDPTVARSNVAVGANALASLANGLSSNQGAFNFALGANALASLTSGDSNVAIGPSTLRTITTQRSNVGIGNTVFFSSLPSASIAIGDLAGRGLTGATTATNNIYIGDQSNFGGLGGLSNAIAIGATTQSTRSNQAQFGNSSIVETMLRGNVSIGTSTPILPTARLDITGVSGAATDLLAISSSTATAATRLITVDKDGELGIGASSPSVKLHISGVADGKLRLQDTRAGDNYNYFEFYDSTARRWYFGQEATSADFFIGNDNSGGTSYFNIASTTGNIGLKAVSIDADFQVGSTLTNKGSYSISNWNGTGSNVTGYFRTPNNNGGATPATAEPAIVLSREGVDGVSYGNFAEFKLRKYEASGLAARTALDIALTHGNGDAAGTNIMSLLSNGNVGIGTTTPASLLNILSATEQLRINYNSTNYFSTTVGSTGSATLDLVGTSPTFTFSDPVIARVRPRVSTTTSSTSPSINTDNVDYYELTAQAASITSFTTNLTGTPTTAQRLTIAITGTGTYDITWGSGFESSAITLPTTGAITTSRFDMTFIWNSVSQKWRLVGIV